MVTIQNRNSSKNGEMEDLEFNQDFCKVNKLVAWRRGGGILENLGSLEQGGVWSIGAAGAGAGGV